MVAAIEEFGDGRAAFFTSSDENWWHLLGTNAQHCLTAEEAVEVAILNWPVSTFPVFAEVGGVLVPVPGKFATVRDHPILGVQAIDVVGARYEVIQNMQAFTILNNLVDMSGAHFETAGSILGGKRVFVTMKVPNHMTFASGQEQVDLYLLAWNSHDGSSAFTLAITPVRVVCKNTLDYAMAAARRKFLVRHTVSATERIEEARRALDLTFNYEKALAEDIDRMLDKVYTEEQFASLVEQLLPDLPEDAEEFAKANREEAQGSMAALWYSPTQDGIRDTAWGAMSTVVEWADFYSPARSKDRDTARAFKVLTGSTAPIKQKAYTIINK